jgi:hypothetical protein
MHPRIEFPESLLNGRPAPPPITLDELQALPAYKKFGLKGIYTPERKGFVFEGSKYSITVTKTRIIYGSYPINMRFIEPNWESLLLNIFLYITARKKDLNFDLAENAYFLKKPTSIRSINFLSELFKFNLVSKEDLISMTNKVLLSKPMSTLIVGLIYISSVHKETLVEFIFKKFGSLKEEEKYRVALYLAYISPEIFQRFLKIYGNEKYERISNILEYEKNFIIDEKYNFRGWTRTTGNIFYIAIKNESDLALGINIIKLGNFLPYFKGFLEALIGLDLTDKIVDFMKKSYN